MTGLRDLRQTAAAAVGSAARRALRNPRPHQRLDLGLALTLLLIAGLAALAGYGTAAWLSASGLTDPPLVAEVEDPRILTDYRDAAAPVVDMVALGDDLLIGRTDGHIDRFDTRTRRFAEEQVPRGPVLTGDLALLSTDCDTVGCLSGGTAHAVTATGGLATRSDGGWQVILGDMAFTGTDGARVEQADVTGWAVSDDGHHVLVNAAAQGIGLFDQRDASWRVLPPLPDVRHGPLAFGGAFWLAGPQGVYRIAQGATAGPVAILPGTEGEILDLALSASDGLLALRRGDCPTTGPGCLSILKLAADGRVTPLLAEVAAHGALSDSGLSHVVLQGDDLFTVGAAGLHRYDSAARHWTEIDSRRPTAHFAETGGTRLHVALPDRFVTLAGGEIVTDLPLEQPLRQIVPGADGVLFGLDRAGQILTLTTSATVIAPVDTGAPPDARFTVAAEVNGNFVAIGPDGVLVHDPVRRRYAFVAAAGLPPLPTGDVIAVPGDAGLWLVSRAGDDVWLLTLTGAVPDTQIAVAPLTGPGQAVVQARSSGAALDLIAASGEVFRLVNPDGLRRLTGAALPVTLDPVAMATADRFHLFTDGAQLWGYDSTSRSWSGPDRAPLDDRRLTDIAIAGDRVLALDDDGTLQWRAEDGWMPVMGGPDRAAFGAAAVQDALGSGSLLYLASDDVVQVYDPGRRSFGQSWQATGSNAELLGIRGAQPVWTNSDGLFSGNELVLGGRGFSDGWLDAAGPVAWFGGGGPSFVTDGTSCLYHGVAPPDGEIRDVAQIDADRLLVLTEEGAGIYEPRLHRWLRVDGLNATADSRLLILGTHLVRLDAAAMASVPLTEIPETDSCALSPVTITWDTTFTGVQAEQVDGADEILLLGSTGIVQRWRDGQLNVVARAPGSGPARAALRRAYAAPRGLDLLTTEGLWHYDTARRLWSTVAFVDAPEDITQIDLVQAPDGPVVTIWDSAGNTWIGRPSAVASGGGQRIAFVRAVRPVLPEIPVDPAGIRDIASFDNRIIVLTDQLLLVYRAGSALPSLAVDLPQPVRGWQLSSDAPGALLLTDGDRFAPLSLHRIDPLPSGRFALADIAASYVPGDDRRFAVAQTGADSVLFRIDRDLRAWRCALVSGVATPACAALAGPPLEISAEAMLAYDAGTGVLMTADGLLVLDRGLRVGTTLAQGRVGPDSRLFRNDTALLFWEGPGRPLWHVTEGMLEEIVPQADHLRVIGPRVAVRIGDDIFGLDGARMMASDLPDDLAGDSLRRRQRIRDGDVLLTDAGRAAFVVARDLRVSDPLLDFGPDTQTALPLDGDGQGVTDRWLRLRGEGAIEIAGIGTCVVPPPAPVPPPSDFIGPPLAPVVPPEVTAPCAVVIPLAVRLAAGERLLDRDSEPGNRIVLITDRRRITVDLDDPAPSEDSAADPAIPATSSDLARLRADLSLVDGRSYLSPPVLGATRLDGIAAPQTFVPLTPEPLPAWDTGWMSWDRATTGLLMADAGGTVRLAPTDMIRDGQFLPMHDARGIGLAAGVVAWVNPFGLWHQQGMNLRRVTATGMATPLAAAQGVFHAAGGGIAAVDGAARPGLAPQVIDLGALRIGDDPATQRVTATLTVEGVAQDALAATGFAYDRRLSVAGIGAALHYLTPVGIIPANTLAGGIAAPVGTERLAAEDGRLLASGGQGWLGRDPAAGSWSAAAPPFQNARLAVENGRVWDRVAGAVQLGLATPGEDWRIAREGLVFDIDRLLAFAATPDVAVAVTAAGTHAAPAMAGLAGPQAPVTQAPVTQSPATGALDARRLSPGTTILYTSGPGARLIWDSAAGGWRAPAPSEQPWNARHAADVSGITVDFGPDPRFEIAAEGPGQPVPFTWSRAGSMPFDHALSLHAEPTGTAVLVGTRLGLRRITATDQGFASRELFLPDPDQPRATAIGRPVTAPDRILADFDGGACLSFADPAAAPAPCAAAAGLDERLVSATALWRWTERPGGVRGLYLLADGSTRDVPQPLRGQLPHDLLSDRLTCAGRAVERWRDQDIVSVAGVLYPVDGISALHCQTAGADLGNGETLGPGLHALAGAAARVFDGSGFVPGGAAQAEGIADRIRGRVVLDEGRLRYGLSDGALRTDYLTLADVWRETGWDGGRLALDQALALATRDGALQVVTPAGVVDAPHGVVLPASLVLMTPAGSDTLGACDVTRVETRDGGAHGVDAAPGAPLRISCADGMRLDGVADGRRDLGALTASPGAAETRVLVDVPGLWDIRHSVGADGAVTALTIAFRDEAARLAAGRFDFDSFQALAAPFAGSTELLTDSGWWRGPAGVPRLADTARGPARIAPRDVTAMTRDLSARSGDVGLCLGFRDGDSLFWDGAGGLEATEGCREARGNDPLWHWWQGQDGPAATATALNGVPLDRAIAAGRFTDLVVTGAPLGAPDGQVLAPAMTGVLVLDPGAGAPVGIYAVDPGGLLQRTAEGEVVHIGAGGAVRLEGAGHAVSAADLVCPALADFMAGLPEGAAIRRAEAVADGYLSLRIDDGRRAVQALVLCADPAARGRWSASIGVGDHPRSLAFGPGAITRINLALQDGAIALTDGTRTLGLSGGPTDPRAMLQSADGAETFLADARGLWSISTATAIGLLGAAPMPQAVPQPDPRQPAAPAPAVPPTPAEVRPPAPADPVIPDDPAPAPAPEAPEPDPAAPPASAPDAGAEPALDAVAVQRALAESVAPGLVVDGMIGPNTRRAIAAWQTAIGSAPTGHLSSAQLDLLLEGGP